MVWHFSQCDKNYGQRVADGIGVKVEDIKPESIGLNADGTAMKNEKAMETARG